MFRFKSESDFPIQFKWEAQQEQACLIVWSEAQGEPGSGEPAFRRELIDNMNEAERKELLENGKYLWGVYDRSEEILLELIEFTVEIPPVPASDGENKDSTQGGTGEQEATPTTTPVPASGNGNKDSTEGSPEQPQGTSGTEPIQVERMPVPSLGFDPNENRLVVKWKPKSTLIDQTHHYEVIYYDVENPLVLTTAQTPEEDYIISDIKPGKTYRVLILAYDSKGDLIGRSGEAEKNTTVKKPETKNSGVESQEKQTSWGGWIKFWSLLILIFSGIIILVYVLFGQKLKQYWYDKSYYSEQHKELLASPNNYVEDRVTMNLRRSVKSIQEEFQDMQRAVKISTTHAKIDHQNLKDEVRRIREIIQGSIEDYVSASQFKSKTESLETLLSQSIERLREDSHREMEQLNEKIASLENDLITLRQERLAEKNAAVVAARKELDILIEQVTTALPQDAANLLNALSFANHADALSHLVEVGQRLLSEICSSKGGASLRAYIEMMDKLQEIREKLDRLLTRTLPDAEQRSSRLLREAQEILTGYTDTKSSKSFNSELIKRTRRALLKEIGMPYISIVMGRFRGNGDKAYTQLAETLQQLGLNLIDITIGQTRPDERLHDVQSAMPPDKYPSGTIANVVKMGYIERATGEISKAQVIVSQ